MTDKFKIILEYIKDLSVETPDAETLIYVKDNIIKYQMNIDITSKPLKNKMIEVNTKLTFQDKDSSKKKSFFEIKYATVITIDNSITDKNLIGRIVLCDLQKIIYPKIENIFLNLIKNAIF